MYQSATQNFNHNLALVSALEAIASNKGITAAQLCIAWVASLGPHIVPIPGSSYVPIECYANTLTLPLVRMQTETPSVLLKIARQVTLS